jgi:hypothetical protein
VEITTLSPGRGRDRACRDLAVIMPWPCRDRVVFFRFFSCFFFFKKFEILEKNIFFFIFFLNFICQNLYYICLFNWKSLFIFIYDLYSIHIWFSWNQYELYTLCDEKKNFYIHQFNLFCAKIAQTSSFFV